MYRTETVTLTNMCMITDEYDNVLIQHRVDKGWPGVVFPGGHVENEESIIDSVKREVKEETGLVVDELVQCGIKQFLTEKDGRYIVFLYRTKSFKGKITDSVEGKIEWINIRALKDLPLAEGFEDMLPLFFGEAQELIYKKGKPVWIS